MAFKNQLIKPLRNPNPYSIRSDYRTDYTGQAGYLVKVTACDPDSDQYYAQGESVGASYGGIYSNKWISPWIVSKAGATDVACGILGITLEGTASEDNHGNKIDGFNQRWADENGYVRSGAPVQIAMEGDFWIANSQFAGNPQPGSGIVPAADGAFTVVDPANLVATKTGTALVGKILSASGTRQGDVRVQINL
jgi:hypothetical protein